MFFKVKSRLPLVSEGDGSGMPVYLVILATLFFIFYTQQEVFNKLTTILASFTVAIPIIIRILSIVPGSKQGSQS